MHKKEHNEIGRTLKTVGWSLHYDGTWPSKHC